MAFDRRMTLAKILEQEGTIFYKESEVRVRSSVRI
jgi:hypothetical protein